MIVPVGSLLMELYKSPSKKGFLVRKNKAEMPFAVQIINDANSILCCEPEVDRFQAMIHRLWKAALVELSYDSISLTAAGMNTAETALICVENRV